MDLPFRSSRRALQCVTTGVAALIVVCVLFALGSSGCSTHTNRNAAAKRGFPVPASVRRLGLRWDNFARRDGPLKGELSPFGSRYGREGPFPPVIKDRRFVRGDRAGPSPGGYSTLLVPHPSRPKAVAAAYVFTRGASREENAVVGASALRLSNRAVQFAVWPDRWLLFTTTRRSSATANGSHVDYRTIGRGLNHPRLRVDGHTRYLTVIRFDARQSAVTVWWGAGQVRTFTDRDPATGIDANWGTTSFAQIRRPSTSDGDVEITGVGVAG